MPKDDWPTMQLVGLFFCAEYKSGPSSLGREPGPPCHLANEERSAKPHWPTAILILFSEDGYSSAGLSAVIREAQDRRALGLSMRKREEGPSAGQLIMKNRRAV